MASPSDASGAMTLKHVAVNGWFLGQQSAGSGQYLHHLLAALPQAAPAVRWTVLAPEGAPVTEFPGVQVQRTALPPLPGPLRKVWWEQVTVPRLARRLRAGVLWVPYWAAPYRQIVPTVVTVHDLIPLLLPGYREGLEQRLYNVLVSATARRAAAVIAVSHAGARDIVAHLRIPAERVYVVHHGSNQEGVMPPSDAALLDAVRRRYGLPDRFFLYLGGFDARKNVRTSLEAYRRYLERGGDRAIKFVLAGRLPAADTPFAPDPRRMIADLGLGDQALCCGWVDEADKPALYALAHAYVFPSLYEGFGMMLLEAMQAGAPVITSAG